MTKRIGIYAGTFNPVHAGHVAFALQAMKDAKLDKLYFLPERRPRHKTGVEHFAHRVAMLKQAVRPYTKFDVLEFDDVSFTVSRTLPKLHRKLPHSQLVFLLGSDAAVHLPSWPQASRLLKTSELFVGVRGEHELSEVHTAIANWPQQPKACRIIESYAPDVSSHTVREALRARRYAKGLLESVVRYSNRHWLYVSLA